MKWTVDFTKSASKDFDELDKKIRLRIEQDIKGKLLAHPNLYLIPLTGELHGFYKFRVGDYRLLCKKEENKLLILIVKIKHRREVYH